MVPIRVIGSVFSLLTGLSAALLLSRALERASGAGLTMLGGGLFIVGAILVVVSVVSFVVPRFTFVVSAVLSVGVLAIIAARYSRFNPDLALVTAFLATVALIADAFAARPSKALAEKDSPLNLPVFG